MRVTIDMLPSGCCRLVAARGGSTTGSLRDGEGFRDGGFRAGSGGLVGGADVRAGAGAARTALAGVGEGRGGVGLGAAVRDAGGDGTGVRRGAGEAGGVGGGGGAPAGVGGRGGGAHGSPPARAVTEVP
ncbi:hypothetical protein GCM10009801_13650 [Streptomyces albiaxialis]|uniref:Uncharacterized protein n=1 Tax=Streptomyces albiaxialis TaxID=329523 RepID=A0ABN2VP52_9ACTN